MPVEHSKQWFKSVDEIYKLRLNHFISVARRHVYNSDLALDVVHDALGKAIIYFNANPERKVRQQIIDWLIIKACKKANRYSREVPSGDFFTNIAQQGESNNEDYS